MAGFSAITEIQPDHLDWGDKNREAPAEEHGEDPEDRKHGQGKDDNSLADDVPGHALTDKARVGTQQRIEDKDNLQVDRQGDSIARCSWRKTGERKDRRATGGHSRATKGTYRNVMH